MITIKSVRIRELRGIRDLEVEPDGKNFVVSGPNGSGKSGIVDAIQFALTGEMSRLTGKGTGGITVQRHGPHVDRRDDPAAAEVTLHLHVPQSGKSAVLTRNVKAAKNFRLEPDDADIRAAINEVAQHPEFTLTRREIIKYILVEAGQRSKEIQAILKLESIGETRGVLKTAANKLSIAFKTAERDVQNAEDAFRRHLDVTSLAEEDVLAVINPKRRTLGLPGIGNLAADTNLSAGVLEGSTHQSYNRDAVLRDLEALLKIESTLSTLGRAEAEDLVRDLTALESDPALLEAITRRSFVDRGLALVRDARCPLCDTTWEDEEQLKAHLEEKLAKADEAQIIQRRVLESGGELSREARRIAGIVDAAHLVAVQEGSEVFAGDLRQWAENLRTFASDLNSVEVIATHRQRLADKWTDHPASLKEHLEALMASIRAKPDQSAAVAAQTFLARAQDRFSAVHSARRAANRSMAAVERGRKVYNTYCAVADAYLSSLYAAVEEEFAAYYAEINADDEEGFKAKLEPAEAGLDLEVAFYDKGMFPPAAYHSEGHQDGMGVCLYLALMRRLLGSRFDFAVLDDVVMSVDQAHRKEFCRLLKRRFPNTQFIITTHDKVWAKQMQTEGLVGPKGAVAFHSWSVQTGPIVEQANAIWEQIEAETARGEIEVASGRLRRHMEYVAGELADSLRARPAYRGDFAYDLGDLLPAVIGRYGELLRQASKAANAWKNEDAKAAVEARKTAWSNALAAYGGEAWVVNKAIHYNDWANFTKSEIREVVEAFKGILKQMECSGLNCQSWLYVTPSKGNAESIRCRCGSVSLNLRAK